MAPPTEGRGPRRRVERGRPDGIEGKTSERGAYTPVSVPEELLEAVDEVVGARLLGYRTRAEFVMDAIRAALEKALGTRGALRGLAREREKKDDPPEPG